ncbi:LamG domain-containing protein [Xanthomarina sp. GH4-25]|uniref:LamG domain-containing protein n=1 Tax=Xanthomarina sp. GH4-25 TaxID=3349335 RepID=UPI00387821BB
MKTTIKFIFLFVSIMLITFTSCQDEVIEETPPNEQEVIQPNSNLANLMRNTSANDGSVDDILDNSDCFTVNLPVTIIANGIILTIETIDDLSLLEAIFDASNTDDDDVEFLFPVTIILNDYTEVNIDSIDALNDFIDSCIANEDVIECVDFVYPISFSIYNTDFQVIETVIVDNDYELYIFLEGLDDGNNGVVLASLNFPVILEYTNGETIEVTNNQELEEAINAANENCDAECEINDVIEDLKECKWTIADYNVNNEYIGFDIYFNENNYLQIIFGTGGLTVGGNWIVSELNDDTIITISELTGFNDLEGDWLVVNCNDGRFVLTQQVNSETIELVLEQDCGQNPFNCFDDVTVTTCDFDNDGFGVFELEALVLGNIICNIDYTPSFHETLMDAENNVNAIAQPNAFTNTTNPQTIYLRIEAVNGNSQVFEITLVLEDCSANCSETEIDNFLQTCVWNVVDIDGNNELIIYDFDFISNSTVVITGNGEVINANWSTSQSGSGTIVEFSNVNGGLIQIITGNWLVVECAEDRLVLNSINDAYIMVMEQDCTNNCNNPGTLTNDLIIYMPFGNEVRDLIGGTVINDLNLVEDRSGNATCAVSFNGTESFSIPVTTQNQLVQGDSFSISLWFKMQNDDLSNLEIFFRSPGNATQGFQLGVYDLNTPLFFDNLNTSIWDNDWNQEVDVSWDNTDWHHLVVTLDSNNTVRLFRDGVLRNVIENSNFSVGTQPANEYILGEGFQGHLDDLRVYKRTLSTNDINDLYNLEADCYQCL